MLRDITPLCTCIFDHQTKLRGFGCAFLHTDHWERCKDKLIWGEDALGWKPDRWLKPLRESVSAARVPGIYANTMTFSGGPRACIDFKFSQLETSSLFHHYGEILRCFFVEVVLAILLQIFIFEPADNKEISFRREAIICPQAVGGSGKTELPIKVSLAKHE